MMFSNRTACTAVEYHLRSCTKKVYTKQWWKKSKCIYRH